MWRVSRPDATGILDTTGVQAALPRYIDIVRGKKYPKFQIAQSIQVDFSRRAETDILWNIHDSTFEKFQEHQENIKKPKKAEKSFLDLKILLAHRIMQSCNFCTRNCKADRIHGQKGYCGAGRNFSLYSAFLHMGEEPELIPSGTIFTGGCSIRCIHCQNWDISQWKSQGTSLTPEMMAYQVKELA